MDARYGRDAGRIWPDRRGPPRPGDKIAEPSIIESVNEKSHEAAAVIGLPLATVMIAAAVGFAAPKVHAVPFSAVPAYSAIYEPTQQAVDSDLHVAAEYEAASFPPAPPGTARTGPVRALPVRHAHGGAAPTFIVPADPNLLHIAAVIGTAPLD